MIPRVLVLAVLLLGVQRGVLGSPCALDPAPAPSMGWTAPDGSSAANVSGYLVRALDLDRPGAPCALETVWPCRMVERPGGGRSRLCPGQLAAWPPAEPGRRNRRQARGWPIARYLDAPVSGRRYRLEVAAYLEGPSGRLVGPWSAPLEVCWPLALEAAP